MNETRVQIDIQANPQKIFSALTTSSSLTSWFAEHAEVNLPEQRYDFWGRFTPEAPSRDGGQHKILSVEEGKLLKYSWHVYDADTIVDVRLVPRDEQTIVALRHTIEKAGQKEVTRFSFEDFWFLSLENLRRYVDGKIADARVDYTEEAMKGDIRHEIVIDAPAAKVFAVLIQPDQLNRWIASNASVQPVKGGEYSFGWAMVGAMKILDIEQDKKLVHGWGEGTPEAPHQMITWTLEETGGKTRLTLVHSGFGADETPGEYAGWKNFMSWIRAIVEYGVGWQSPIVPLPEGWESIYPATIAKRQNELIFDRL